MEILKEIVLQLIAWITDLVILISLFALIGLFMGGEGALQVLYVTLPITIFGLAIILSVKNGVQRLFTFTFPYPF